MGASREKAPFASDVAKLTGTPSSRLSATAAPGTTAPLGSNTTPWTDGPAGSPKSAATGKATKEMRARTAFMRHPYLQPESVLELRGSPVETRYVVSVEAAEPAAADHEKEVIPGPQDPAEAALESEDSRWAVVLH